MKIAPRVRDYKKISWLCRSTFRFGFRIHRKLSRHPSQIRFRRRAAASATVTVVMELLGLCGMGHCEVEELPPLIVLSTRSNNRSPPPLMPSGG